MSVKSQEEFTFDFLNELPSFYKKSTVSNTYQLMFAIAKVFEDYDLERSNVELEIYVNTATGDNLDSIGRLFLLPRRTGESDDSYRARIKGYFQGFIGGGTIAAIKAAVAGATGFTPSDVDLQEEFTISGEQHRFLTTNDYYLMNQRDVLDNGSVVVRAFVGGVWTTLINGTDYEVTEDSRIDFTIGGSDPDNDTIFEVDYDYFNEMIIKVSVPVLPSAFSTISVLSEVVEDAKAAGIFPIVYFKFTGEEFVETILVDDGDAIGSDPNVYNHFIIDVSYVDGEELIQ